MVSGRETKGKNGLQTAFQTRGKTRIPQPAKIPEYPAGQPDARCFLRTLAARRPVPEYFPIEMNVTGTDS
jgi:hypothetical protein